MQSGSRSPSRMPTWPRRRDVNQGEEGEEELPQTDSEDTGDEDVGKPSKDEETPGKGQSRVRFHETLKLVLIPNVRDYKNAGLVSVLWWSSSDFFQFQQSAHSEIRQMAAFDGTTALVARRKLYQPHTVSSDTEHVESAENISSSPSSSFSSAVNPAAQHVPHDGSDEVDTEATAEYATRLAMRTLRKCQSLESFKQFNAEHNNAGGKEEEVGADEVDNADTTPLQSTPQQPPRRVVGGLNHIFRDSIENLRMLDSDESGAAASASASAAAAATASTTQPRPRVLPKPKLATSLGDVSFSPSLGALEPPVAVPDNLSESLFSVTGPEQPLVDNPKSSRKRHSWAKTLSSVTPWLAEFVGWASALTLVVAVASTVSGR